MPEKNIIELEKIFSNMKKRFDSAEGTTVRVGWFGNILSGKMRLAEIARILNYGHEAGTSSTGRKYSAIPERNFMRLYEKNHLKFTYNKINKELKKVISNNANLQDVLKAAGTQGVSGLTKAMNDPIWKTSVPNSPETIKAWAIRHMGQIKRNYKNKGEKMPSDLGSLEKQPLRDTGHLIQSIHWDVKKTI